ncbi:MAG TPA: hypothetical protein VD839_01715 [Burkholderiales bacterium]|jgi:hypothetical protein|nr:hypothetical protein [Burkholderiales bacterium]
MHYKFTALITACGGRRRVAVFSPASARSSPCRQRDGGNAWHYVLQPALPREGRGFFGALPACAGSAIFSKAPTIPEQETVRRRAHLAIAGFK